jgi:hypothetical protein
VAGGEAQAVATITKTRKIDKIEINPIGLDFHLMVITRTLDFVQLNLPGWTS